MNIPVDPLGSPGQASAFPWACSRCLSPLMSQPATQTVNQPVQRSCPPGLPTVRVPNSPVRPFRARDTMRHPAASDAIDSRHPHAQALAREPSGLERASLRVSRPLQGASRRPTDAHSGSIHHQSRTARSGTRRVSGSAHIMPDPSPDLNPHHAFDCHCCLRAGMPRTRSVFQGAAVDQLLLSLALGLRELPEGLGLDWFSCGDLVACVCPPGRGACVGPCRYRPFQQHSGTFFPDRLVEIRSRLVDLVDATAAATAEDPAAPGWAQQLSDKGRHA